MLRAGILIVAVALIAALIHVYIFVLVYEAVVITLFYIFTRVMA